MSTPPTPPPEDAHLRTDLFQLHMRLINAQLSEINDRTANILKEQKITNGRVNKLEGEVTRIKAVGATISAGLTFLLTAIGITWGKSS